MRTSDVASAPTVGGLERLGREASAEILAVAAKEGPNAATALALRRDPNLWRVLATTGRADWRFHLPAHTRARAVVVGSGLGGMAFDLCEDYGEVVSCEPSAEARSWQEYRAVEDHVQNVRIVAARCNAVPLPDACADVVALDRGVLLGLRRVADVRPMLLEARRVLKPDCWLYWGFENRNERFRIGRSTPGEAEPALRATPTEARRVVEAAGFRTIALYWVRPRFDEQVTSAPLYERRMILEFLRSRHARGIFGAIRSFGESTLARAGLLAPVAPYLFLLAQRGGSNEGAP